MMPHVLMEILVSHVCVHQETLVTDVSVSYTSVYGWPLHWDNSTVLFFVIMYQKKHKGSF